MPHIEQPEVDASDQNANPEDAAITGTVPAAAEAPPTTRGRAASAEGSTLIYFGFGVLLLLTALIADQSADGVLGTAIAGISMLAIGVMSVTGLGDPITIAVLGFVGGVLFTVIAFSAADFGFPQFMLLVAGAATFIASFASLASARRPATGGEEPQPGVESV